jgi:hypothetical protein
MMVIFLVGIVSMILMRTLRKDYARYNEKDIDDMVSGLLTVQVYKFQLTMINKALRIEG